MLRGLRSSAARVAVNVGTSAGYTKATVPRSRTGIHKPCPSGGGFVYCVMGAPAIVLARRGTSTKATGAVSDAVKERRAWTDSPDGDTKPPTPPSVTLASTAADLPPKAFLRLIAVTQEEFRNDIAVREEWKTLKKAAAQARQAGNAAYCDTTRSAAFAFRSFLMKRPANAAALDDVTDRQLVNAAFPNPSFTTAELLASHGDKIDGHTVCVIDARPAFKAIATRLDVISPDRETLKRPEWRLFSSGNNFAIYDRLWGRFGKGNETLVLVAGESGSGKTHLMFSKPPTWEQRSIVTLYFSRYTGPRGLSTDVASGDAVVADIVQQVKTRFLRGASQGPTDGSTKMLVRVVFDEMGGRLTQLRLLCRRFLDLEAELSTLCNASVRIWIAGTGIDLASQPVGSTPKSFNVLTLEKDRCVWVSGCHALLQGDRRFPKSCWKELVDLPDTIPCVADLIGNPRAATLLWMEILRQVPDEISAEQKVDFVKSVVANGVAPVAYKYRPKNGMKDLKRSKLRELVAAAVRFALCQQGAPRKDSGRRR